MEIGKLELHSRFYSSSVSVKELDSKFFPIPEELFCNDAECGL